jgi:hypothetical protein
LASPSACAAGAWGALVAGGITGADAGMLEILIERILLRLSSDYDEAAAKAL